MEPIHIILSIIAVIEVYYWFVWIPHNWRTDEECQRIQNVIDIVYKQGHGIK